MHTIYNIVTEKRMLTCKNKLFNKFLFLSLAFLFISILANSVIAFSATPTNKKNIRSQEKTNHIQAQQRQIINHLERIEDKIIISEKRN